MEVVGCGQSTPLQSLWSPKIGQEGLCKDHGIDALLSCLKPSNATLVHSLVCSGGSIHYPHFFTSEMEEVILDLTIIHHHSSEVSYSSCFPALSWQIQQNTYIRMVFNWDDPHYLWWKGSEFTQQIIQSLCKNFRGRVWGRTKCMGQKTLVPRNLSQKQIASLLVSRWWR